MAVTVAGIVEPVSRTGTTDPWTWSHDQGTTSPQGVLVGIVHGTSATDHVTGVTYGGVALARFQRNTDTVTELGAAEWWFLGNSVPTGTQTVSVELSSGTTDDFTGISITLDGLTNLQVVDVDGVSEQATNPSVTLQYTGRTCMAFAAIYSGQTANSDITANETTITKIGTVDLAGNFSSAFLRQVTAGSADFAMAAIMSSDHCAYAVVAVSEAAFFPSVSDTVTLTDIATVVLQYWWSGAVNLLDQPHLLDTSTITETSTVRLLEQPRLLDAMTLTDSATVLMLLGLIQASDVVTLTDSATVGITTVGTWLAEASDLLTLTDDAAVLMLIPGSWDIVSADQVDITDAADLSGLTLLMAETDTLTAVDAASLFTTLLLIPDAGDMVTLSESLTIGLPAWWGQMHLLVQPHAGESLTLTDVETVGNDRSAEIAWIEFEVPASSTEIDVPFGQIQAGQIQVQLKYRGHTNKVRAILATNMSGHDSTFTVNDNGTEHLVTIPDGVTDQELPLDEEVTFGVGVTVNIKMTEVEPQ